MYKTSIPFLPSSAGKIASPIAGVHGEAIQGRPVQTISRHSESDTRLAFHGTPFRLSIRTGETNAGREIFPLVFTEELQQEFTSLHIIDHWSSWSMTAKR